MCLGRPMLVQHCEGTRAQCVCDESIESIDLSLIGPQEKGTWVLVFLGVAREVLTAERVSQVRNALMAVDAVMRGNKANLDLLFSDLIEHEPTLPPHLQNNN